MTTAHRPTFHNALGGDNQGGNFLVTPSQKLCSRDLNSHTSLKSRSDILPQSGVGAGAKRSELKQKLELREKQHAIRKAVEKSSSTPMEAAAPALVNRVPLELLPDVEANPFPEDMDDEPVLALRNAAHGEGSDSDDASSDDDDADLMRELEKIKQERLEEEMKAKALEDKEEAKRRQEEILRANPLLMGGRRSQATSGTNDDGDESVNKRPRWDDDVVFRNQAKNLPKPKKRFINDTVRNEFHKRFLAKYIV